MKEELSKIREALKYQENMAINGMASHRDCIAGSCATALTLLDSILAELDSPELVEKVDDAICMALTDPDTSEIISSQIAQAAINIIKGK